MSDNLGFLTKYAEIIVHFKIYGIVKLFFLYIFFAYIQ